MKLLNRKIQPAFKTIEKIDIIRAKEKKLDNGIPVYSIHSGTQDLIRIEWIFGGGNWVEDFPLQSKFTNSMLTEGTRKRTAAEIAEYIDYYGAYVELMKYYESTGIVLYTLNKYLDKTLIILEDLVKNSIFPLAEFEALRDREKQKFQVELTKVKTLAKFRFDELIFGQKHPYGKSPQLKDFDSLTTRQLSDHYLRLYSAENCHIIVAGLVKDDHIELLNRHFGSKDWKRGKKGSLKKIEVKPGSDRKAFIEKTDSVQNAIRIGKPLFDRKHPDFFGLNILNTVLGGYFGSRLMTNIREDKGYTYGIYSLINSYRFSGYFVVASEVGSNVCSKAIKEVYKEIKKLRQEPIPGDELITVKNYILGEMVRQFDGPFELASVLKVMLQSGLNYDYYDSFIRTVKSITQKELMALAEKHLHEDSMYEVVAGK